MASPLVPSSLIDIVHVAPETNRSYGPNNIFDRFALFARFVVPTKKLGTAMVRENIFHRALLFNFNSFTIHNKFPFLFTFF